ncbi:hypothetical protein B9Q02_03055 [Candidatus Marsarchaeota G1 archaeon BE_D]|uniref:HTH asnC-type domain-containing protein n=3 Tax=Candidatus Marsarchaeota TaxID=1978152 RepID=A0A2R6C160_9ARCH|nr:MAG: hypothetical protein B9Q02_03055 [Candidatus Marsarchaeota G1 archaeon BE_D]PSO04630.1 MAG: hypothetical protein B9Q12_02075 [Candidatus Marsarchaeota G2 archaeon ECH_B_SAG-G06]
MQIAHNLTKTENRVLSLLVNDARMPVSKISREIGVSRASVNRAIYSLLKKGYIKRFTVELGESAQDTKVFVKTTKKPEGVEHYELLDGSYLAVLRVTSLQQLKNELDAIQAVCEVMIAKTHFPSVKQTVFVVLCDKCGKPIQGDALIVKRGRKTLYACCETCKEELQKK